MNIFEIKVHPAADIFPMIPKDELEELAADIKANGLIHPIVVKENVLIDGRNRRAACKLAGVEPETTELNGEDIGAYIISSNVMHRRLTRGQSAMAVAMVHREAHSLKSGDSPLSFDSSYLTKARLILGHSENLAREVMAGNLPFDRALTEAKNAIAETKQRAEKMAYLEENHPSIVSLITEGELSLDEGWAVKKERSAETEAAISGMNGTMKNIIYLEMDFHTDISAERHAKEAHEHGAFFEHAQVSDIQGAVEKARNLADKLNHFVEIYNVS